MSVIVWSDNTKIRYVNEMLLIRPGETDIKDRLASVVTILYQNKEDNDKTNWGLNILQRGMVRNIQQLFPMHKETDELTRLNNLYNNIINKTTEDKSANGKLKFKDFMKDGLYAEFGGTPTSLYNQKIKDIGEDKDTIKRKDVLGENIPFSVIKIGGQKERESDRLCMARLSYDIGTEIAERDAVEGCPYFENILYNILTPKRVYEHLFRQEIEEKVKNNTKQLGIHKVKELVDLFKSDLEIAWKACPLILESEDLDYYFDLLIVGTDNKYRYTAGFESRIIINNLGKIEYNKDRATIIYASPNPLWAGAYFPLIVQKKADKGERCTLTDIVRQVVKEELEGSQGNK